MRIGNKGRKVLIFTSMALIIIAIAPLSLYGLFHYQKSMVLEAKQTIHSISKSSLPDMQKENEFISIANSSAALYGFLALDQLYIKTEQPEKISNLILSSMDKLTGKDLLTYLTVNMGFYYERAFRKEQARLGSAANHKNLQQINKQKRFNESVYLAFDQNQKRALQRCYISLGKSLNKEKLVSKEHPILSPLNQLLDQEHNCKNNYQSAG